jgi:hypothetical protein
MPLRLFDLSHATDAAAIGAIMVARINAEERREIGVRP